VFFLVDTLHYSYHEIDTMDIWDYVKWNHGDTTPTLRKTLRYT